MPESARPAPGRRRRPPLLDPRGEDARGRVFRAGAFYRRRDAARIGAAAIATVGLLWAAPTLLPAGRVRPAAAQLPGLAAGTRQLGVRGFTRGSCVAFAPAGRTRSTGRAQRTVLLDATGGGPATGVTGRTDAGQAVTASALALAVEMDAVAPLRSAGDRVVVTRATSAPVAPVSRGERSPAGLTAHGAAAQLAARLRCARLARPAVVVTIGFAAGSAITQGGTLAVYPAGHRAAAGMRLARPLADDVRIALRHAGAALAPPGVAAATDPAAAAAGSPLPTAAPAAMIAPLFLTNPVEATLAASPAGERAAAHGIAAAVAAFLR